MFKEYIVKNGKKLRCGITTGTCAAAASAAAVRLLLSAGCAEAVDVRLPGGDMVRVETVERHLAEGKASCCVRKYSGDDPDVTDGVLIWADASLRSCGISIEGGTGVGRVTQRGLDCPVGGPAINSVPRRMIEDSVAIVCKEAGYEGGIDIVIRVPDGEGIAKKTFNPQLGIVGGISIIGTTGIVEPMSEKALVDSLLVEMKVVREKGYTDLLAFPGNYAQSFIDRELGIRGENSVKFSNYLGDMLDFAVELGFEDVLIVGHIGKLVKVAGGMMNTHSHNGDFRMEMFGCYAAANGAETSIVREILGCVTTEQALCILERAGLEHIVMENIGMKTKCYIDKKVSAQLRTELIIYSNDKGILYKSGR